MNGRDGNSAVAGVVNLVTWMGRVGRTRQKAGKRPRGITSTALPPRERIRRCVNEISEVAENCLLTQAQYDHNGVDYFLEDFEGALGRNGRDEVEGVAGRLSELMGFRFFKSAEYLCLQ